MDMRSMMGYSKGSPWENAPYNLINTSNGRITMSNTKKKLKAFDAKTGKFLGNMIPGQEYQFPSDQILEVPHYQKGGRAPITVTNPNDPRLKAYTDSLTLYQGSDKLHKNFELLNYKRDGETRMTYGNWKDIGDQYMNSKPITKAYQSLTKFNQEAPTGKVTNFPLYEGNTKTTDAYLTQFKKPVQPVVYKKPESKGKILPPIYTDDKNDPRLKAYSDSLLLSKKDAWDVKNIYKDMTQKQMQDEYFNKYKQLDSENYKKVVKAFGDVGYMNGKNPDLVSFEDDGYTKIGFKNPKQPYIYKEQKDYPIRTAIPPAQVKGTITPSIPTRDTTQDGVPIYGPANSTIGYYNNGQFNPYTGADQRGKVNNPDTELMKNPEELRKYLQQKGLNFQPGGSMQECPQGYVKDETGQCVLDNGFNSSQEEQKGMPIVPMNNNGQMVGGVGADIDTSGAPSGNPPNKPHFRPKLPNTGNIAGALGAVTFGLSAFSNHIEEARQKAWNRKQMAGNFNGTYSNAQNDYGVDPYEQTGQLRNQFKKGGKFNILDYLYGDDKEETTKSEEKQQGKKPSQRITQSDVEDSLGFSPEDILNETGSGRKSPIQGMNSSQFRTFATPEEGQQALENQLNIYKTDKSKTGVKSTSSLYEAMSKYAPASDNNNPTQYANTIAKVLGISPNTPISNINTKDWANIIKKVEGNKVGNNPGNLKKYKSGGTYELNEDDIKRLTKLGYKFQRL